MSRLGDEIRQKMGSKESKEILASYTEALEGAETPGTTTFSPKLSKLLSGDPEGERYFLEKPNRCRALEKALGVEEGWLAAQRQVRVLVLDPQLPERVRSYLLERQEQAGGFACREVSLEGPPGPLARKDVLARIRELADREPDPLVIARDRADAMYFEGAKLSWTVVEKHPRGFLLESDRGLVPLPEPSPPLLFSAHGEALMPHPDYEEEWRRHLALRHDGDPYDTKIPVCKNCDYSNDVMIWRKEIAKTDVLGQVASFPVQRILDWILSREGIVMYSDAYSDDGEKVLWFSESGENLTKQVYVRLRLTEPKQTIIWLHEQQLFAIGPLTDRIAQILAPYHQLQRPDASLATWREMIDASNPWRIHDSRKEAASERFKLLKEAIKKRLGFSIFSRVELSVLEPKDGPTRLANADEAAAAQEKLASLAARSWGAGQEGSWPLRLDAASRSRLQILHGHGERLHVLANLGAGHLLRIQVAYFPQEEPTELVAANSYAEYDGGDVHVWFQQSADHLLEGSALPAREERRRRERS